MAVDFPDTLGLDDSWRLKLEEAQRRYSADSTEENRAEFRRALRLFADLVVRDMPPPVEAYPQLRSHPLEKCGDGCDAGDRGD
jgi:hypothetical protein